MSGLLDTLAHEVDALDGPDLDRLADSLAPLVHRLASRTRPPSEPEPEVTRLSTSEWLDSKSAAQYLGVTRKALYHYKDGRDLPSHQREPGGKLWFKRSELDTWRTR